MTIETSTIAQHCEIVGEHTSHQRQSRRYLCFPRHHRSVRPKGRWARTADGARTRRAWSPTTGRSRGSPCQRQWARATTRASVARHLGRRRVARRRHHVAGL